MKLIKPKGYRICIQASMARHDNCINWPMSFDGHGYGRFSYGGKKYGAHRFSLALKTGGIFDYMACHTCHTCHNAKCINPNHLYWGNSQSNVDDMIGSNRMHRGVNRSNSKLNESQVISIRNDSRSYLEISNEFNIAGVTVYNIKKRKTWKHI